MSKLENLVNLLAAERIPVAQAWRDLGMMWAALSELVRANRDELAEAGVMPHAATVSQASTGP